MIQLRKVHLIPRVTTAMTGLKQVTWRTQEIPIGSIVKSVGNYCP